MRRLALVLALGLAMVGLLLAAGGGISGPGNDLRSASYDELAADAPTGSSGETSPRSIEPPSARLLDQTWSDYVYDTPAVARVGVHVVLGDGGVSSPAVAGDGAAAVPDVVAADAATTPPSITSTPRVAGAADDAVRSVDDVLGGLGRGRQPHVRTVGSDAQLRSVYDDLARGGTPTEWTGYKGTVVRRPDGVEVGIRPGSSSGGATVDIRIPGQSRPIKVHIG